MYRNFAELTLEISEICANFSRVFLTSPVLLQAWVEGGRVTRKDNTPRGAHRAQPVELGAQFLPRGQRGQPGRIQQSSDSGGKGPAGSEGKEGVTGASTRGRKAVPAVMQLRGPHKPSGKRQNARRGGRNASTGGEGLERGKAGFRTWGVPAAFIPPPSRFPFLLLVVSLRLRPPPPMHRSAGGRSGETRHALGAP